MEMTFTFPGGSRVDGIVEGFAVRTDQPPDATAPGPFALFLASIGACAGVYIQAFCQRRGIPVTDIRIVQRNLASADGMVRTVEIEVELPEHFPAQYRDPVLRAADQCKVKRHLENPPTVTLDAVTPERPVAV